MHVSKFLTTSSMRSSVKEVQGLYSK